MRSRPESSTGAYRIVRKRLADGTIREYRYAKERPPKPGRHAANSIGALLTAYRQSPEWAQLAKESKRVYGHFLKYFEDLAATPVADLKRRDVLRLRDAIAFGGRNGAANMFVRVASALFGWAVDRDWLEASPTLRIKSLPSGHLPAWTVEQAELAIAKLPERLRRVVLLGMYTGQRRGDLISMTWSAYDGSAISVRQQKTGTRLSVPVHPRLKVELDLWRAEATAVTILTSSNGKPWQAKNLSDALPAELRKIGLPAGINVHGLRKLAATMLADAGCSTHEIAAITGHRTLAMVALYTESASQRSLADSAILRLQTPSENQQKLHSQPIEK